MANLFYALILAIFVRGIFSAPRPPVHLQDVSPTDNLCQTPACVQAASAILNNLASDYKNLDPCTDFEEMVCGGWREKNDLRPDQVYVGVATEMADRSYELLRQILEAPYPEDSTMASETDKANFDKMKDVYNACLDEAAVKDAGIKPLKELLDHFKTSFGPAEGSNSSGSLGNNILLLLERYAIRNVVSMYVDVDDRDPNAYVVTIDQPGSFGLPSTERYDDEELVAKYLEVTRSVLSALDLGIDADTCNLIVDFEKTLANAIPSPEESSDVTQYYNPMSLKEAAALIPQIDLEGLLGRLVPNDTVVEQVIVASPEYLEELSEILQRTPGSVVHGYFLWKTVQSLAGYVEAEEVKPYIRFRKQLAGLDPDSEPERWETCVSDVGSRLPWILSRFYVEKAFSPEAKALGDAIVGDIKAIFTSKLEATPWMDDETTARAIEKVKNIVQKIGYPTESPDIFDPEDLQESYASLNITTSYFANELTTRLDNNADGWAHLGEPVDKAEWGMSATEVNAYYSPSGNEIAFPAGIMQFPVFNADAPSYLNYGAFGAAAGHELSHAFDDGGRHFDQDGRYTDWWSNATVEAFEERAQCFVDQYDKLSVPGPDGEPLYVDGSLTLGENIADAGGLTAAFQAWKKRSAKTPDKELPGLEFFSQEQLFFVSYATWWCGKARPEFMVNTIAVDPHAPSQLRVLGTTANSREFRESFQCKQREPTCELW